MKFIFNNKEYPSIDGVKKAYYGGQGPVPPGPDYTEPFYVQDLSGSENTVQITKYSSYAPTITIEKSTDGITWETMGTTSSPVSATIPANGKLYLRCNTVSWGSTFSNRYSGNQIKATGSHKVGGNIMSLLYGANFTGDETVFPSGSSKTFYLLFQYDTYLMDASELLLPSVVMNAYCYGSLFSNTSITTPPALPATTLADSCYGGMFQSCKSLTTSPALPATTLAQGCYQYMFAMCTSLTTAPVLPATILVNSCYGSMFKGCANLNYIKCIATDISASSCTYLWVDGVAATGIFIKEPAASWSKGTSGIPNGWTVVEV